MRLKNKKTGKILDKICIHICSFDVYGNECKEIDTETRSLEKVLEVWEDYKPAEPLIKDEKIRKAVRAWAEMNDIRFVHMCSRTRKENARIVGQNALGRTFTMEIDNEYEIRVCFKDYKECYTIAELCGEEEE